MSLETPFKISIPQEKLDILKKKLELTTLPDELDNAGWDYGAPLADVRRLVARWKDGYDWRKEEAKLNEELPQFTRDIDVDGFGTINIHYVHQKSTVTDAIPLLFVHGWPGSFIEVRKILPLLASAAPSDGPSFHVVALGLANFGFSEGVNKQGFAIPQYAELGHNLMLALGYNEYVTQGGDWGYEVTRSIATLYGGKHSKAWHTNSPVSEPPAFLSNPVGYVKNLFPFSAEDKVGIARAAWFPKKGQGYSTEQATQPQTLGYSLADSPVGLLSWIYEKLHNWTDSYEWEDDEILTWISIYWFSRAGPAASLRIYYESTGGLHKKVDSPIPKIPTGVSMFPRELDYTPKRWLNAGGLGNLVFLAEHKKGGHFAAHEQPEELVGDLRKMFGKGGSAFGVVPGKTGYA